MNAPNLPATHCPAAQLSPTVQASPSSQVVPLGAAVTTQAYADAPCGLQTATSQDLVGSVHCTAGPMTQAPALQRSLMVQPLPSPSQALLSIALPSKAQVPVLGSQRSAVQVLPSLQLAWVWVQPSSLSQASVVQTSPSSQFCAAAPLHSPPAQAELALQTSPSSQGVPDATGATLQSPVATSQALCRQVTLLGGQKTTELGLSLQAGLLGSDLSQYGTPLQRLPSSFLRQSLFCWHSQVCAPATHWPPLQKSALVQVLPSSQAAPVGCGVSTQAPVLGWH